MAATKATTKSADSKTTTKLWSDVEKAAMQESVRERKRSPRLSPEEERAAGEADVQAKFAEMKPGEQAIATRIHAIVQEVAPDLVPRTYYGMPAYAKDGKVICFFQPASKFKVRYSTFGFQPDAALDQGGADPEMWPVAFALLKLSPANEQRIAELVKRAAS